MRDWSEVYRPRRWDDVLGQDNLKPTIIQLLLNKSFPKLGLFTGPSGVGKSTLAELCAMTLVCEKGGIEPCCECSNCRAFLEGKERAVKKFNMAKMIQKSDTIDVIHKIFDFESLTGKSVYILEEIHELSANAQAPFLEELTKIPDDVSIIMCTTKPYSIINELRNRATPFPCELPTKTQCKEFIKNICRKASIKNPNEAALDVLINVCERNPRMIINVLQLFSTNQAITADMLSEYFGLIPNKVYIDLLEGLLRNTSYSDYCSFIASLDDACKVIRGFSEFFTDVLLLRSSSKYSLIDKDKRLPKICDALGESGVLKVMNFITGMSKAAYSNESTAKLVLLQLKAEFMNTITNQNSATVLQLESEEKARTMMRNTSNENAPRSLSALSKNSLQQSGTTIFVEDDDDE